MADPAQQGWRLTPDRLLWLAGALVLVVLPHAQRVPAWVTLAFVVFVLWRIANVVRGTALPRQPLGMLLGLLVVAGVYLSYGTVFGRNPGVALLVALTGMKLLETRSPRDAFVGVLLGYFLVVTNFLYSQTIPTGVFMFVVVVVMTGALIGLTAQPREVGPRQRLLLAGSLLVQSLPVMLVLFLIFPRIPGPLWGLPEDAHGAISGLSDRMSPGSISSLSLSEEVAFRVKFDGPAPPPARRYWRGPVLWLTDGTTWRRGHFRGEPVQPVIVQGPVLDYTLTLEPHDKRWMFLLEAPVTTPERSSLRHDYLVLAASPVRERTRYRARAATRYKLPTMTPAQRSQALQLPADSHPRARELAARWRAENPDPPALVERALGYFNEQPFFYTLDPPLMSGDAVDQFLFEVRRGFCEHYAAAFTVLMRAAGVPARVVTGYQGGQINPVDGYLIVRQRDAHAWSEVWLGDGGWVRVDPTAAVSPARIEQGMDGAIPPRLSPIIGLSLDSRGAVYGFLRDLRFGWDAVNNWWAQWVLGYGPGRQKDLLSHLGLDPRSWAQIGSALITLVGVLLAGVGWWLHRRMRPRPDAARRLYDRFCRRLARRGVARRPAEGPLDFARRAGRRLPRHRERIGRITEVYTRLRYQDGSQDPRELRELVRGFRP